MIDIMRDHYQQALPGYRRERKSCALFLWVAMGTLGGLGLIMAIAMIAALVVGKLLGLLMLIPIAFMGVLMIVFWAQINDLIDRWDRMISDAETYLIGGEVV